MGLGVQEVRGPEVVVALLDASRNRVDLDRDAQPGLGRVLAVEVLDGALDGAEVAPDVRDREMPDGELGARVRRVDRPRLRGDRRRRQQGEQGECDQSLHIETLQERRWRRGPSTAVGLYPHAGSRVSRLEAGGWGTL